MIVCRNKESAVFNSPASRTWETVRRLNFAELNPSLVKSCSLLIPGKRMPSPDLSQGKVVKLEDVEYHDVPITEEAMLPFMCTNAVGSLRQVVYKDGAEFVFRIIEISDISDQISFELIQTDATVNVSGVIHTLQVLDITETRQSLIVWTTEFASDADQHVISDSKYKKLDAFKDMRRALEK